MIVTCKKHIPTHWILFAIVPWTAYIANNGFVSTAFVFSLRKFIENPVGLTFILSLPNVLTLAVAPVASFMSDRIWTRVGRRKPFMIVGFVGMITGVALMPLMPTIWGLLAAFFIYQTAYAISAPLEALKQEIIPPAERGFATGAMTWCGNLASVVFYFVLIGRFDDVTYMAGWPINGEQVIYWSVGLLFVFGLMIIVLGIRETDPHSELLGQRISWRNIAGGLLDRELWPVYLLVLAFGFMNFYSALGPLSNLLYTEQWGYTKQEMGVNVAIGGIANIFIIGLLTVFADRLNRMRAFQTTIILQLLGNVAYYCYVNLILPDKRPTLVEIILFGEVISILSTLASLLYLPLAYDYVRRNKMGTYGAGWNITLRLTSIITLNSVGIFVWAYAVLFQPPAGEMTRVALRRETSQPQLLAALTGAPNPNGQAGGAPPLSGALSARVWQATGVTAASGWTWEVRQRDKDSEHLAANRTRLEASRPAIEADERTLRNRAAAILRRGEPAQAGELERAAGSKEAGLQRLNAEINAIDSELAGKAAGFRDRVAAALGNRLISAGDQLLAAHLQPALLVTLATTRRASDQTTAKMLADLRRQYPAALDLHAVAQDGRFSLSASILTRATTASEAEFSALQKAIEAIVQLDDPGLLTKGRETGGHQFLPAISLDLATVEEPALTHASPVTRGVNLILGWFGHVSGPDGRLLALARTLRSQVGSDQIRVDKGPVNRSISVTAILQNTAPQAASLADPLSQRLQVLLGNEAGEDATRQARAFYDRIEAAAALQRITLAQPLLTAAYAPMRYDYMSGYLCMFGFGLFGISLTVVFVRREKKGLIRKYGVEEALA